MMRMLKHSRIDIGMACRRWHVHSEWRLKLSGAILLFAIDFMVILIFPTHERIIFPVPHDSFITREERGPSKVW